MVKRPGPLEIYKYLPKKADWKSIGYNTGMEFATDLLERKVDLEQCPNLKKKNKQKILDLITPPQLPVTFGVGDRQCLFGGEEVLNRHDLTFFNQTAICIDLNDAQEDLMERVKYVTDFKIERIGEKLTLDAIALRCVSNDPDKFASTAKKVTENTDLPLILCSWNIDALIKAAETIKDKNPMLYAATKENWKKIGKCAVMNNLPVVCYSQDLDELVSIAKSLENMGVEEIAFDPGTMLGEGLSRITLNKIQKLRFSSIGQGSELTKWPIIGVPAAVWAYEDPKDSDELLSVQYQEALGGVMMMSVDVSLVVIHTGSVKDEVWLPLALMTFRQNIFTDPRVYPRVDPGLEKIGNPGPKAPVFMTSNYRMTKIPVQQDIKDSHVDAYLLVVDTDGLGIEAGVAGGQMTADKIAEAVKEYKPFEKVDHRVLVFPGMAARLQGATEDEADCYVAVGPMDSSGIQKYMEKSWKPDEFMKEYEERK